MSTADVDLIPTFKVPIGDGPDNRTGNRIFVKSVYMNVSVTLEAAATMRIVFYKNKNGT